MLTRTALLHLVSCHRVQPANQLEGGLQQEPWEKREPLNRMNPSCVADLRMIDTRHGRSELIIECIHCALPRVRNIQMLVSVQVRPHLNHLCFGPRVPQLRTTEEIFVCGSLTDVQLLPQAQPRRRSCLLLFPEAQELFAKVPGVGPRPRKEQGSRNYS